MSKSSGLTRGEPPRPTGGSPASDPTPEKTHRTFAQLIRILPGGNHDDYIREPPRIL